jgi:hypothetical protein
MSSNVDPKFVPTAKALSVVGLRVSDIRRDEDILKVIEERNTAIGLAENQISVAICVLQQRGWTNAQIGQKTNYSERTVTRKGIEGLAILRTSEVTRTVAAIRAANLSKKVVDACTKGAGDAESKIAALERAALASELQSRYVTDSNRVPDAVVLDRVVEAVREVVETNAEPANAASFVDAIPSISESMGLKAKDGSRSGHNQGGSNSPQAVEFHLRAALRDAQAIANAADADYVPTPQDIKALFELTSFLNIELALEPEVAQAVEALA